jgi:glycosyltransferase involved in cell wall biosynthesis
MSTTDSRPKVGQLVNTLAPYAVNLNRVLAAGLPEVAFTTLTTHRRADFVWGQELPAEVHTVDFSAPDDRANYSYKKSLQRAHIEWPKGRRIAEYLIREKFAALIMPVPSYLSYFTLMRTVAKAGIPIFIRSDASIRNEAGLAGVKKKLKAAYYASWMKHVSGVMTMGEYGDRFFAQYWNRPERVYRVPYWPDYELFARKNAAAVAAFRLKVGLAPNRRAILFSGRLIAIKGVDLLIDAFTQIADRRPDWDLVIVGAGPSEQELRQRVPERLRERVRWSGFMEPAELVAAYHAAELVVVPSRFEPWAVVVQEALAAGRPVIASDIVGAAQELVSEGRNGRIFPSNDLAALTTVILDVSDDNQLPAYQAATKPLLDEWMRRANPVPEVRRALTDAGVLSAS